jgi:hypothetical protein
VVSPVVQRPSPQLALAMAGPRVLLVAGTTAPGQLTSPSPPQAKGQSSKHTASASSLASQTPSPQTVAGVRRALFGSNGTCADGSALPQPCTSKVTSVDKAQAQRLWSRVTPTIEEPQV